MMKYNTRNTRVILASFLLVGAIGLGFTAYHLGLRSDSTTVATIETPTENVLGDTNENSVSSENPSATTVEVSSFKRQSTGQNYDRVIVGVELANTSKRAVQFSAPINFFLVSDSEQKTYQLVPGEIQIASGSLSPGEVRPGNLIFDVFLNSAGLKLVYQPSDSAESIVIPLPQL